MLVIAAVTMFGKTKKRNGNKEAVGQGQRQGNKVEVVKSVLDVRMPSLADLSKRSSSIDRRRRRPSLDSVPDLLRRRFSRSETALVDATQFSQSHSEVSSATQQTSIRANSHQAPSRCNTTAGTRPQLLAIQPGKYPRSESRLSFKSAISPLPEEEPSNYRRGERPPSSLISPLSLELPHLGPPFGEGTFFDPMETINEMKDAAAAAATTTATTTRRAAPSNAPAAPGDDRTSSCYSRTASASSAGSELSENVTRNPSPINNTNSKDTHKSQNHPSQPITKLGSLLTKADLSQSGSPAGSDHPPSQMAPATTSSPPRPRTTTRQPPPLRTNTSTSTKTPPPAVRNPHYSVVNPVAAGVFDDNAAKDERSLNPTGARSPINQKLMDKPLPKPPLQQLTESSPSQHTASAAGKNRSGPQKTDTVVVKPPVPLRTAIHDLEPVHEERVNIITSHPSPGSELMKAATELEQELRKIGATPSCDNGDSPLIPFEPPKIVGEGIAPLAVSVKPKRSQSTNISGHPRNSVRFQSPPSTSTPPAISDHPALRHIRTGSGSSHASKPGTDGFLVFNPTPPTPASPVTPTHPLIYNKTTAKRRLRFGLPGRRGKNDVVPAQLSRSRTESELEKASKSFDRQFAAQMARALSPEEDKDEGEDADHEWSTLLPLKAVKQLGIPLMTSSHIPRLSAAATDKNGALRASLSQMGIPSTIIQSPPIGRDASVPPFLSRRSSRTRDTIILDSPIDDEEGGKIVIGISKLDYLFPDTAPQETHRMPVPELKSRPPLTELNLMMPQICELDAGSPLVQSRRPSYVVLPLNDLKVPMPDKMPDVTLLALMECIPTLDDLFNLALANKRFYRVFKKHELRLMKAAMFKMSPPAWELREMSPPWGSEWQSLKDPDAPVPEYTPTLYLRHHARDIFTLVKLKSLILARCGSFLRPDTVRGLSGHDENRAAEVDEAFWRIWTFCRIFGSGKNREMDVTGQADWLDGGRLANRHRMGEESSMMLVEPFDGLNNVLFDPPSGFGQGNGPGLTPSQLYDMTEIWNCLGVLLQIVLAQCTIARRFGIYDGLEIKEGDTLKEEAVLEEWTFYVLTLGPSAVVALSSVCPVESAEATFAKAKQMGLTKWEAPGDGASRASFMRDAISRTYESRMAPAPQPPPISQLATTADRVSDSGSSGHRSSDVDSQTTLTTTPPQPQQQYFSSSHSYLDVEGYSSRQPPPPEMSRLDIDPEIQFIDPTDKAIHRIVHGLGFSEHDAKWALKMTDSGDAIDADAAVALLLAERKKREHSGGFFTRLTRSGSRTSMSSVETLVNPHSSTPMLMNGGPGWRWA